MDGNQNFFQPHLFDTFPAVLIFGLFWEIYSIVLELFANSQCSKSLGPLI